MLEMTWTKPNRSPFELDGQRNNRVAARALTSIELLGGGFDYDNVSARGTSASVK